MTQTATVKSVNGDKAVIEVSRKAMCDGCHNSNCGGSCPMSGIFSSGKMMTTTAVNKIGAVAGDIVEIETEDKEVLGAALLIFLLPLVLGGLFYTVTSWISDSSLIQTVSAITGFLLPFPFMKLLDNKKRNSAPKISIVRIVKNSVEH